MSQRLILQVAVNVPLSRLFDYLPPKGVDRALLQPGVRLQVPFGRRQQIAVVMARAEKSDVPVARLKAATALLDESPILGADELWLIRFTSDYYHHPIGEVVAAALPAVLRAGKPPKAITEQLVLTATGRDADIASLLRRAPRQAEVLQALLGTAAARHCSTRTGCGWRRPKTRSSRSKEAQPRQDLH